MHLLVMESGLSNFAQLERLEQELGNRKGVNQHTRNWGDPLGEALVQTGLSNEVGWALPN